MNYQFNLGAFLMTMMLLSCSPAEPGRIAMHNYWLGYQTISLALEQGWLNHSMVKIVDTSSASDSMEKLRENKVDAAALTLDEAVRLCAEGVDLSVIMLFDISSGADVILSSHDLNSLKSLNSISIAFEQSGSGSLMFAKLMETTGIEREKFVVIDVPANQHLQYWNENHPDILITYEPMASDLQKNSGALWLTDTSKIPETVFDVLAVRNSALQTNPKLWKAVVLAQQKAVAFSLTNTGDFLYRLAGISGLDKIEVEEHLRGLILPNAEYSRLLATGNSSKLRTLTGEIEDILFSNGTIKQKSNCSDRLIREDMFFVE